MLLLYTKNVNKKWHDLLFCMYTFRLRMHEFVNIFLVVV